MTNNKAATERTKRQRMRGDMAPDVARSCRLFRTNCCIPRVSGNARSDALAVVRPVIDRQLRRATATDAAASAAGSTVGCGGGISSR